MPTVRPIWPRTPFGIAAVCVGLLALSLWFVLPMVTMHYREIYPITDTWVMPLIGGVVTIMAALVNGYAVLVRKERAWLNLAITLLVGLISLVALIVMIGGMVVAPSA